MKKVVSLLIITIVLVNSFYPVYASGKNNCFELGSIEQCSIDGDQYEFYCYIEQGNNAVKVKNMTTQETDILLYDKDNSTVYLNGEMFCVVAFEYLPGKVNSIASGWETISSYTNTVTWSQGTTSARVASAIATILAFCGPTTVIACVGLYDLAILANNAIGCTLYIDLQQFVVDISFIQYRYLWSFVDTSGVYHGLYIYTV